MADRHFIKSQPVRVIKSNQRYWDWVHSHGRTNEDGEYQEMGSANPDIFAEKEHRPTEAQMLMGDAINHLQGRQKEVYLLIFRHSKSIAEAATILGITKSSAQVYKARAVKFLTAYCRKVLSNAE